MVRVQQPYSKAVRQPLYNILGCFYILLTVQPNIMIIFFTNLMQKFFILIHLLYSSTCFEHYYAHLQEDNCISTAPGIVTLETSEWSKLLKYVVCCII